jgi:hypothetical protein
MQHHIHLEALKRLVGRYLKKSKVRAGSKPAFCLRKDYLLEKFAVVSKNIYPYPLFRWSVVTEKTRPFAALRVTMARRLLKIDI